MPNLTVEEAAALITHPRSVPTKGKNERWDKHLAAKNSAENKLRQYLHDQGYWSTND